MQGFLCGRWRRSSRKPRWLHSNQPARERSALLVAWSGGSTHHCHKTAREPLSICAYSGETGRDKARWVFQPTIGTQTGDTFPDLRPNGWQRLWVIESGLRLGFSWVYGICVRCFAFDRENLPRLRTGVYHFLSNSGDTTSNLLGMNRLRAKDCLCAGGNW
jgi:hypothetical protein